MAKRVFLIVLDSFGVGAEPDAPLFGDVGTNTLGAIAGHPNFKMILHLSSISCRIYLLAFC